MNSQEFEQDDGTLRRVLHQWPVKTPLPPRFQEAVWGRIELTESRSERWTSLFSRLLAAIARPGLATSYLILLLLAGVLAGYWQARLSNAQAEEALSARYVQLVDPYQAMHH